MTFKKKKKIILLSLGLLLIMGITGSYMWDYHNLEVDNVLQSRTVDVVIEEVFEEDATPTGTVSKDVDFKNTGTASVFLRFTYAESWETETEVLEDIVDVTTLNWTEAVMEQFQLGEDGWYYYQFVLPAGDELDLLECVTFGTDVPEDADYNLMFQVETVQVSDESGVNEEATKELFGKVATLSDTTIRDGAVTAGTVVWEVAHE